jgi:predicted nucleotidyltransferase
MLIPLIEKKKDKLIELCKAHRVISISLFGSAATGTMQEQSDIDFLVQFSDEIDLLEYADNYFSLLEQLELLLGRSVDLISIRSLKNPIIIEEIRRTKVDLYAA